MNHQLRKILFDDVVRFEVRDGAGALVRAIELLGSEIRKRGLWKDITNKALGGLPGVQKEGTDGVITSAEFILYPAYPQTRTLCLEFFGPDFDEASQVILEIAREMPNRGEEALSALEHFDDQYVKAIGYQVKAPRTETPKAVHHRRRGRPHPRAGGAAAWPASAPSWPPTARPSWPRRATPPRASASGPTARSSAPSPGAPTPSR